MTKKHQFVARLADAFVKLQVLSEQEADSLVKEFQGRAKGRIDDFLLDEGIPLTLIDCVVTDHIAGIHRVAHVEELRKSRRSADKSINTSGQVGVFDGKEVKRSNRFRRRTGK